MKKNWKIRVIVGIFILVITILFAYWQLRQFELGLIKGPDLYDEQTLPCTYNLLDSAAIGLRKYHTLFGHYPQAEGKYFFNSIKQFINVSDVYVYADSFTTKGDTIIIRKHGAKKFDYLNIDHTYLGVGIPQLTITYRRITPDSFLLYSVGKNLVDENGKDDDIVYERKK